MIPRTLARLTVASLAALTLGACQDREAPMAPTPKSSAPRFSVSPNAVLDQQNLGIDEGGASTRNNSFGQSFTAGVSGQLSTISVQVYCAKINMPDAIVEVYKGQYDSGNTDIIGVFPTAIASQAVPGTAWPACSNPLTTTWVDISFDVPAPIVTGQVYTFRLKSPNDDAQISTPASFSNSYAGGSAFFYSGADIVFKTYVIPPTPQLDQQNLVSDPSGVATRNTAFGQSFTAGQTGQLTSISVLVNCSKFGMPDGTFEVYSGQYDANNTDAIGVVVPPIATQPIPATAWPACSNPLTTTWVDVAFTSPPSVVAGQTYTFRLKSPNADAQIWHPASFSNPYAGGTSFFYSRADIVFKTYVLAGAAPTDVTPPVITPMVDGVAGSNGWYTGTVNVSWTVMDAESSISSTTGCGNQTVANDTDNNGITFTCSAQSSGGTTTQSVTIKRDATGPTLNPTISPDPLLINAVGSASPGATDGGSGLASASCGSVVTSSVGQHTVLCEALDKAGNSSQMNFVYNVYYPFSGFLGATLPAPMMNSTKAGTSAQLRFNLGGNRGLNILAAGSPMSQTITCSGAKPTATDAPVAVTGSGLTYDSKSGQYTYTWKTDKAWAGSCKKFILKLVDGSENFVYVSFTK